MVFRFRDAIFALALALLAASFARAQSAQPPSSGDAQALRSAIEDLKKEFDQRLAALETRLAAIEKGGPQPAAVSAAAGAPPPSTSATGASVSNAKVFNPDMAVIGDFLGALGRTNIDPANRITPDPAFQMHESEAAFQAGGEPRPRAQLLHSLGAHRLHLRYAFLTAN